MEKHELKNRVDEIERALAIALEFAFKEKRYRYGRAYEWLARAYRMTDSLKIILSAEEREERK